MKKKVFVVMALLIVCSGSFAQQDTIVPITGFEDGAAWAYESASVVGSYVETSFSEVKAQEGDHMLYVEYDNFAGAWNWAQLNFLNGPVDLRGLSELRMWVFFNDDILPNLVLQIQASSNDPKYDINLGNQTIEPKNEWQEVVWKIDPITSQKLDHIDHFGGFINPGETQKMGVFYIDNIYAIRPAGVPEYEIVPLFGFNSQDAETGFIDGWKPNADTERTLALGAGEVEPSEGENYAVITLSDTWVINFSNDNSIDLFDRWADVDYFAFDIRVDETIPGTWMQVMLVLQSAANSWDQQMELQERLGSAKGQWHTVIFDVDMTEHAPVFSPDYEGRWWLLTFVTNNDGAMKDHNLYIDNFRAIVPKQDDPGVADWNLF